MQEALHLKDLGVDLPHAPREDPEKHYETLKKQLDPNPKKGPKPNKAVKLDAQEQANAT